MNALLAWFDSFSREAENLAVYQIYCDESGKLNDANFVVFASLMFNQLESAPFCEKWNGLLDGSGIKFVSMKEAMHFKGEFKGWSSRTRERDELLEALASLAWDRCTFLTSSSMDTAGFRSLSVSRQKKLKDLPYTAFEVLVKNVAALAAQHNPRSSYHLIYDLSEEYSAECLRLFNRLQSTNSLYKSLFASISFADDCQFPPLQAADMFAYCKYQQTKQDIDKPIITRLLELLDRGKPIPKRQLLYSRESGLGDGVLELPTP